MTIVASNTISARVVKSATRCKIMLECLKLDCDRIECGNPVALSLVQYVVPSAQPQALARPLFVFVCHFMVHCLVYDHLLTVATAQTTTPIRRLSSHHFHFIGVAICPKAVIRL